MKKIRNCAELRRAIARGQTDYAILLAGRIRSSKFIDADAKGYFIIHNLVDDTMQVLKGRQLYTRSNIGEAMRKGAFIVE